MALEKGFKCPKVGKPCVYSSCGDGCVGLFETCDTGNNDDWDGCDYKCQTE